MTAGVSYYAYTNERTFTLLAGAVEVTAACWNSLARAGESS